MPGHVRSGRGPSAGLRSRARRACRSSTGTLHRQGDSLYGRHVNPTSPAAVRTPVASLGMYPFAHVLRHWDRLWERIAAELPGTPRRSSWDRPSTTLWRDPALLVGRHLRLAARDATRRARRRGRHVRPGGAVGGRRALPIGARGIEADVDRRVAARARRGRRGERHRLALGLGEPVRRVGWTPEHVLVTGAHVESLRAVARGDAQVASIDAVTFELAVESEPMTAGAVHVIGHGPLVPALPIVTVVGPRRSGTRLRAAIAAAVARPGDRRPRARRCGSAASSRSTAATTNPCSPSRPERPVHAGLPRTGAFRAIGPSNVARMAEPGRLLESFLPRDRCAALATGSHGAAALTGLCAVRGHLGLHRAVRDDGRHVRGTAGRRGAHPGPQHRVRAAHRRSDCVGRRRDVPER